MNNLSRLALLPLPLLMLCPVHADINPSNIAADAQWVVAIDLNDLRNSTLGKGLMDMAQKQMAIETARNPQAADLVVGNIRINYQKFSEMVGSVTAYGSNFSPDPKQMDGALVFQGTPDLRKIAEALALQGTLVAPDKVKELKDLPFAAYELGGELIVAFPPEPVIIVSKSKARLLNAHDVVRGAAPSLAKAPAAPLAALLAKSGHSFLVAASVVPPNNLFTADGPQTRILQLMSSGMFAVGEEEPRTVTHMQLVGSTDESADKLLKIIQGMVAMMSLAESTDKQLAEFLQSATVEKQGRTVSVQLAYSSDRVVQMVQSTAQQLGKIAPPAPNVPPPMPVAAGKVVAEWSLGQAPLGAQPGAALLADHTIENVSLVNGATITLTARRDLTGSAIFDCVDILPASGAGSPLHFEAENMRLQRYRVQDAPYASRGKFISLNGSIGSAQFDFPGEDGNYRINVRYIEQAPGKTSMSVTVKNPDAVPALGAK